LAAKCHGQKTTASLQFAIVEILADLLLERNRRR
jgi:hypothetical protein